ncbi:hypothetical protein Q3H92_19475, partial [Curtobacterium flaccumfaciens]|nr:hypothetical protein [Curtobacterium flaccumfaciens]
MTGARITALGTAAGAVGTLGLGAFVARRLLFPTPYTATATVRSATDTEVDLTATRDTRLPGTYDLQRDDTRVQVGAITTASTAGSDGDTVRRSVTDPVATGAWGWDALRYDGPDDVPGTEPDAATTHVVHV